MAADGAQGALSAILSPTSKANGLAVRSFVKPGTHSFKADKALPWFCSLLTSILEPLFPSIFRKGDHLCPIKVVFYPRSLLPGFCVVSRELEGFLSVTSYIMPNCSAATAQKLASHAMLIHTER